MGKCVAGGYTPYFEKTVCNGCTHKDVCGNKDYLTENVCADRAGWTSVKDRLPLDGCDVIIAFRWRGAQANWSEIGRYDELKEEWYSSDGNLREVTHWMPLPEPPKEVAHEK